ncbi:MAG: hypothetical protein IJ763_09565 [Lachnospiraceae bacterium]|nr:hypothetical protein [Lachnospiraceae bacterium]
MIDKIIMFIIGLIIFSSWTIRLDYKIFDRKLKKYIMGIGGLLIFWIIIRVTRLYDGSYFFWYLYYVALIFVPALYYLLSRYLSRRDNKAVIYTVFTVSTLLLIMVLTNDLHNFVFRINYASSGGGYKQNTGYYMVMAWIICLFLSATVRLVHQRRKYKKDIKLLVPFVPIILGIVYTVLYIKIPALMSITDMSIIIGFLIFVGIEGLFVVDLVPNNINYDEIFKRSLLPVCILSKDGRILYRTRNDIEIPDIIIRDIREKSVEGSYVNPDNENHRYEIEVLDNGYAVIKIDYSNIEAAKEDLSRQNVKLKRQEKLLNRHRKIKEKIYEAKINSDIMENLSGRIDRKKARIEELMNNMDEPDKEGLYEVKYLISYCKRMSNLIVSNYNYEMYDKERIKTILDELLIDSSARGIYGHINVSASLILESMRVTSVYEILFTLFQNIRDIGVLVNVSNDAIELSFDERVSSLKQALMDNVYDEISDVSERNTEDGTRLTIKLS